MKRALSIALSLLLVLCMMVSCGNKKSVGENGATDDSDSTQSDVLSQDSDETAGGVNENGESVSSDNSADDGNKGNDADSDKTGDEGSDKVSDTDSEEDDEYKDTRKKITFGSYPQSEVTDATLKATLTSKAGTLPTKANAQKWTSYKYYHKYKEGDVDKAERDFMWYIDVEEGGEKYRGVYFTSYRPNYTSNSSSASNSYQDNNGYNIGNVYWFKYEPISWTVLDENTSEKTAFILCDMIIDSQEYYLTDSGTRNIGGETVYPNDYAQSTIRKWLNETFYNTAFNQLQRAIILTTSVDNGASTTGSTNNSYACEDTQDKIFLLSYEEATNSSYGLNSTVERRKKTTDYAKSQGVYIYSTGGSYAENGDWWLRSPYSSYNNRVRYLEYDGYLNYYYVDRVAAGVVPALKIKL